MTADEQAGGEAVCPNCGGGKWVTASDATKTTVAVVAICVTCGYLTSRVVELLDEESE